MTGSSVQMGRPSASGWRTIGPHSAATAASSRNIRLSNRKSNSFCSHSSSRLRLALLYARPERIVDDAEVQGRRLDPLVLRALRQPLLSVRRVLDPLRPVPHVLAAVERVVQHAGALAVVAVDPGRDPL